jgi:hypothetical protein
MLRIMKSIHSSVVNSARSLVQVEGGELDGRELRDEERGLLVGVVPGHVDLCPYAAGEQAIVIADVVLGDVNELVPEVGDLGPVARVGEPHLHLVDEGVAALLFDTALRLRGLVGTDVVVGKGVVDDLEPHLDRHPVGRRAVLAEEVLQDEHRDIGTDFDLAYQILADDLAREHAVHLVVECVSGRRGVVAHRLDPKPHG